MWNTILDLVTLGFLFVIVGLVGAGAYTLHLLKAATETAVKATAEETAKATVKELQWPMELARELQKTRGVERQELRYQSYGALWSKLRTLAIYDEAAINRTAIRTLSTELSDWYFSPYGGLLLTRQARDFYFALQDLLRTTSQLPMDWSVERADLSEDNPKIVMREMLQQRGQLETNSVYDYFDEGDFDDWQRRAPRLASDWKTGISRIAATWTNLSQMQRFAVLQQTGSILRTSLATDLESRLR